MINLDASVSRAQFGRIVGVTGGRVSQLIGQGVLAPDGTLADWLRSYCQHLRTQASGRATAGNLDLSQERANLALEQRRIAELRRGEMEGSLIDASAVADKWARLATETRDSLLTLPDRLAPLLEMRPLHFVRQLLDTEIRAALHSLADG
jgi:phage terminase Nu1 subunit (DNA packaging protein)